MSSTDAARGHEDVTTTVPSGENRVTSERADRTDREPLTILRVAADLYPDVTGGGAIHAHAMSKRQAARGHDVTVLTSDHGDRNGPAVEARDGYTVVRNRQLARPFGNSIAPGLVGSLAKRLPAADVVHAHSHLYFSSNVTAGIARLTDTPLVLTNHGLVSQTAPGWVQALFLPTVGRFTFDAAQRVLCYTETDERRLRDRGVDVPIAVVENGIDCQRFTPGPDPDDRQLLFVGRLVDRKGVPTLLSTFARLARTHPDLTLRIVGDGPGRSRYERQAGRLDVDDRVTFVGDVSYEAMPRYYRESVAFVLPSKNEGLPRTILESLACETPVVTGALPQIEPVVDGAGFTVPPEEPEVLADAVERLLEDDDRRREFGRRGRKRVVAEHVWSETVAKTTDVFYDLLADAC